MKTLLVAGFDPSVPSVSGVQSYVQSLATELSKLGEDVTVLGIGSTSRAMGDVDFRPVAPHVRNSFEFISSVDRYLRGTREMWNLVHAQRPDDLVPFHLRQRKATKVVTLHGVHGLHVTSKRGSAVGFSYHLAERLSLRWTDAIICVSLDTSKWFRGRYPGFSSRFRTIPAGIDLVAFAPRPRNEARERLKFPKEGKLVAFVGRFEPEKDPVCALETFKTLRSRHEDLRMVMVGDGQLKGDLLNRTKDCGGTVTFRGPMPHEELGWVLSAADVLLVSSRHEGLPTVALESLACGTPVVGTTVGILPDLIRSGMNGYLVPSPNDLEASLEGALYETEWHSADCRSTVEAFGWDHQARAVLEVYHEVSA